MAHNDGMRGPSPHPEYDDGDWRYPEPAVSESLRHAREELGHELRDVSKELRIRYDYLLAIEEGRYDDLPGATYAIGFVRSYAEYLGLDSDDTVQRFKTEVRDLAAATQDLSFPAPKPEGRIPGIALVLISVLLIALVYGAWYLWNDQGRPYVELLPGVAEQESLSGGTESPANPDEDSAPLEETAEPVDEEATAFETASPDTDETPTGSGSVDEDPPEMAEGEDVGEVAPTPDELSEAQADDASPDDAALEDASPDDAAPEGPTADDLAADELPEAPEGTADAVDQESEQAALPEDDTPAETGTEETGEDNDIPDLPGSEEDAEEETQPETASGRVYGEENEDARIVLEATSDSWVQIRDVQGELVFTRVLRAGESYLVPDEDGMTLLTGNAGGLDIRVDGSAIPSLGGMGTVRRDVPLDPQELTSGRLQQ